MNLFLVVFLGVCVATAIWSVFLVRRAQDWRWRFLTLAVGVMPLYQAIGVLKEKGIWSPGTTNQVDGLVELVIAVMWFAAVLILQVDNSERKCAQVRQRLVEALEGAPQRWHKRDLGSCDDAGPRKRDRDRKREFVRLPLQDSMRLLDALHGDRFESVLTTALSIGAPYPDVLALQWVDVDFPNSTIAVSSSAPPGDTLQALAANVHPKRSIQMPPLCLATLQRHWAVQHQLRQHAGERWHETGLVFTSPIGAPLPERSVVREYRRLLEKAGLPKSHACDLLSLDPDATAGKAVAEYHANQRLHCEPTRV